MDQEKRKIIIYEIEHWRKSKLLPEQYCDFLLNLYDANPQDRDTRVIGVSKLAIRNSNWKMWLLGCVFAALVAFIVFHFNSFPFLLQIMSVVVIVGASYGAGIWYSRTSPVIGNVLVGAGSLALLGAGFYLLKAYGADEPPLMLAFVALCGFVWILVGIAARMGLFQYCGWCGLILVYAALLHDRTSLGWAGAQLSWLPVCVLFGWLGYLFHKGNKSAGAVLLLVSFTLWWMPELYSAYTGVVDGALLQLLFLGKLVIAGGLLFGMRKKWIEWVF